MAEMNLKTVISFPMRLEIRYGEKTNNEIWIRWYPDDCQIFLPVRGVSEKESESYTIYKGKAEEINQKRMAFFTSEGVPIVYLNGIPENIQNELKKLEDELSKAWMEFVVIVGLQRARFMVLFDGKNPDFLDEDEKGDTEALQLLFGRGAKLDILPERVFLYALTEKRLENHLEYKLEYLDVDIKPISKNIVFAPHELDENSKNKSKWLFDFAEAVNSGMGVKIKNREICKKIESADWLIACGYKNEGSEIIKELLLRNKAKGMLDVLRQGTVTNNTEDGKTDYTADEVATEKEKKVFDPCNQREFDDSNKVNGNIIARHLGIESNTFKGIDNAYLDENEPRRLMKRLIWNICSHDFFYALVTYVAAKGKNPPYPFWFSFSKHFEDYVLGNGLIPSLRIGENPYGIIPVTNQKNWKSIASDSEEERKESIQNSIATACRIFRDFYLHLAQDSPRIDVESQEDIFDTLVNILQFNAVSNRVNVQKYQQGQDSWQDPQGLDCPLVIEEGKTIEDLKAALKNIADYLASPPSSGTEPLSFVFSHGFGFPPRDEIPDSILIPVYTPPPAPPHLPTEDDKSTSLFIRLLQYSAYISVLMKNVLMPNDKSLLNTQVINDFIALLDGLSIKDVKDVETILLEVLDCLSYRLDAWISSLSSVRLEEINNRKYTDQESIAQTIQLDKKRISEIYNAIGKNNHGLRLTLEFLPGACRGELYGTMTQRQKNRMLEGLKYLKSIWPGDIKPALDVITSLIENLYQKSRSAASGVGVYGWLEKPCADKSEKKSDGFFQAPSLNQAVTGAILRSAAMSGKSTEEKDIDPFMIDLSSDKVRKALWFTHGLQKGYSPAELLGYQVERELHDRNLDEHLLTLRKLYPLSGQAETEVFKNSRVIDGEKFLAGGNDNGIKPTSNINEIQKIRSKIEQIRDAVADLYTAEALHQAIHGNPEKAGLWLDVAEGKKVPLDPEIIKTPRTGHSQTQRVVLPIVPPQEDSDSRYDDDSVNKNPWIIAEPVMGEFCKHLLSEYEASELDIEIVSRESGEAIRLKTFVLYRQPEDNPDEFNHLYMEIPDLVIGGKPLVERLARIYVWEGILERKNSQEAEGLEKEYLSSASFQEFNGRFFLRFTYNPSFNELIRKTGRLNHFLKSVGPLEPEDIENPKDDEIAEFTRLRLKTCDELVKRLEALMKAMDDLGREDHPDISIEESLDAFIEGLGGTSVDRDRLQQLTKGLSKFGLPEALIPVPLLDSEEVRDAMAKELISLKDKITERKAKVAALNKPNTDLVQIEDSIKNAVALLKENTAGEAISIFPPIYLIHDLKITEPTGPEENEFETPLELEQMFGDYRKVRKNIDLMMEVLKDTGEPANYLKVFTSIGYQLSKEEALIQAISSLPAEEDVKEGIRSKVFATPAPQILPEVWNQSSIDLHYIVKGGGLEVKKEMPIVGIKVDDWPDFIPNATETTALAFNYETSHAEAPQAILIAVPHSNDFEDWKDEEGKPTPLAETVVEAINLMRIRSVSSEQVVGSKLGNLLPTLVFHHPWIEELKEKYMFPSERLPLFNGLIRIGFHYA